MPNDSNSPESSSTTNVVSRGKALALGVLGVVFGVFVGVGMSSSSPASSNGSGLSVQAVEARTVLPTAPTASNPDNDRSLLASCSWDDLKNVVVSLSSTDAESVCRTLQLSLGRMPTVRLARVLSKVIFIMRVGDDSRSLSPKGLGYQIMNVVEARGATASDTAAEATLEVVTKIYNGSQGHVMPADLNITLRAMGPDLAGKLSDDGIYGFAALIQEDKKAHGQ